MSRFSIRSSAALALAAGLTVAVPTVDRRTVTAVCEKIADDISSSSTVIYALDALTYADDIAHWFLSSTQDPTCILEAGSAEDVAKAIKIIGANKTPFAVYSGGHAAQPGYSSTTGVQISFQNMEQVTVSDDQSTIEIGMGQNWASVYEALDGTSLNVVGGRVEGPGVGGFTLGGGYSWLTNQYGLTCDTVQSYELVLPNGTISTIDSSQPDLFFALKGGLNRFGIVTSAEYTAFPQGEVYAGVGLYDTSYTDAILKATHEFLVSNTDPKAQIITTLSGAVTGTSALVLYFYDGASEPASFAPFDAIPALVTTVGTTSFSDFVSGVPSHLVLNARGTFNTFSTTTLTEKYLQAIKNESDTYGALMLEHGATMLSMDVEPFLSYGEHAVDSAYPHSGSPLPLNLYFAWTDESEDAFWYAAMKDIVARLEAVAKAEGIYDAAYTRYPNYAITGTTADELYGATNAARLSAIRAEVDPDGVMELAGGFAV